MSVKAEIRLSAGSDTFDDNVFDVNVFDSQNVALDLIKTKPLRLKYGVTGTGPLDLVASSGTLEFWLRNDERNSVGLQGAYSPRHVNCLGGWNRGTDIRLALTYADLSVYKFTGKVDVIDPTFGRYSEQTVRVVVVDVIHELVNADMRETQIQVDQSDRDALAAVLDYALDISTYRRAVLEDEPYLYSRLGETSGTVAYDSSSFGANGTYEGAVTLGVPGSVINNFAVALDGRAGVDSYVTFGTILKLNFRNVPFALEFSLKWTVDQNNLVILSKQLQDFGPGLGWSVKFMTGGKIVFYGVSVDGNPTVTLTSLGGLNDGLFHLVIINYSTTIVELWIDGVFMRQLSQ